jgi:hypothetical protein
MNLHKALMSAAVMAVAFSGAAYAQKPMKLTAEDYIEIQQLSAKYSFAIDTCTNNGLDYANLYTEDGEFGVSQEWGKPPGRIFAKGREALAKAAGGSPTGCVDPKTTLGYGITHMIMDHVITPTATGAVGRCKLLAVGVGNNPLNIEQQGGYEDIYVKTKEGWRFKQRVHVFPNMATSIQFGKRKPADKPAEKPAE